MIKFVAETIYSNKKYVNAYILKKLRTEDKNFSLKIAQRMVKNGAK